MIPTFGLAGSMMNTQAVSGGGGGGGSGGTWNPADKTSNLTLSAGDLTAAANTGNFEMVRTVKADFNTATGGKFYWEMTVDTLADVSDCFVGVKAAANTITSGSTPLGGTYALWRGNGQYFSNGGWSNGSSPSAYAAGDVLMFALDVDNGKLFVGKNGTWNNSGDPVAGTNASFTSMPTSTDFAILFSTDNVVGAVQLTLVSDAVDFTYTEPSGFDPGFA